MLPCLNCPTYFPFYPNLRSYSIKGPQKDLFLLNSRLHHLSGRTCIDGSKNEPMTNCPGSTCYLAGCPSTMPHMYLSDFLLIAFLWVVLFSGPQSLHNARPADRRAIFLSLILSKLTHSDSKIFAIQHLYSVYKKSFLRVKMLRVYHIFHKNTDKAGSACKSIFSGSL